MTVKNEVYNPGAGAWAKFRLLMWKNFLQQWRHRTQTAVELLLPVLTVIAVVMLRARIKPVPRNSISYPLIPAHALNYSTSILVKMNMTEISIAYSPESEILEDVVRCAIAKLVTKNYALLQSTIEDHVPDIIKQTHMLDINKTLMYDLVRYLVKVHAYSNSSMLEAIYLDEEQTRSVIAAVEFDDNLHGVKKLPEQISYSLRLPARPRMNSFYNTGGRSWRSDSLFSVFRSSGPRFPYSWEGGNDPGYINEMFIALQHVISSELVSRLSGIEIDGFEVNIQRYPHPSYIEDNAMEVMQFLFPMVIMLSFSYTAVNIVRGIALEKELHLKETLTLFGLPAWIHWTAWFFKHFLYLVWAAFFILIIIKVKWFTNYHGLRYSMFINTPESVLFSFLMLYVICTICFCFLLSCFFYKGNSAAVFAGLAWFVTSTPAFWLSMDVSIPPIAQALTCLGINSAMSYGVQLLLASENSGGMQWGKLFKSPSSDDSRFTFGHVLVMLVVDCVIYLATAMYFEQVMPGTHGTGRPWHFFLHKRFWCGDEKLHNNMVMNDVPCVTKECGYTVGVQIKDLSKVYGNKIAVDNLSLNIYEDQITVLLGHNSAGKSTTISMLTGNLQPSSGSIHLAGYDMATQPLAARSHVSLCPQHNVLFSELTVHEHLEFFARLKGLSGKELFTEIDSLIEALELQDKRDYQAQGLSGGQKRRLCVGIALIGGTKVVLLDEPTSGMDPAARRSLWDLLQKEKKGRSIILTTHFMDEADILGDRVAIMAGGRLQCVGSPYFLKRHYGIGYTLVLVKAADFRANLCTELVASYIPGIAVKEDKDTEISYKLTKEYSHIFERLLTELENNKDQIKFKNYGLIAATLEDVFMSVGSDTSSQDASLSDQSYSLFDVLSVESKDEASGLSLACQHIWTVWFKLWLFWKRSWPLVLLQVFVPLLMINTTLGVLRFFVTYDEKIVKRELALHTGYTFTETLLTYNGTSNSSLGKLAKEAYHSIFTAANIDTMRIRLIEGVPIENFYLKMTQDAVNMGVLSRQLLTGATFTDGTATAWFSNFGYHDVATSLAAVHAALLRALRPSASLVVNNYPLQVNYGDQSDKQIMMKFLSMQVSSGIGNSFGIISAVFIMFYIKERVSRAQLMQKISGIKPFLLWFSAAAFDWLWFTILSSTVVSSCLLFNVYGLCNGPEIGRLYVVLMVYGAAMLPIIYILSFFFNGPAVGFGAMFFINMLLGLMGTQIVEVLAEPYMEAELVSKTLDFVLQCFPLYSLIMSIRLMNLSGLKQWACAQRCVYLAASTLGSNDCSPASLCLQYPEHCCESQKSLFTWEAPGILRYLVSMLSTCVGAWFILLVMEYRIFDKILYQSHVPSSGEANINFDDDVMDEEKNVKRLEGSILTSKGKSLIACGITKKYGKCLAVDRVSFSVGDKECFGLLGANGAGKTSTFKMLLGDERISSGEAFVAGHSVRREITSVHEHLGYCPQFDAVFGELTGRETLRLFAMLRGLRASVAATRVVALSQALGFTQHLDKRVDQYSGGNRRKLSTAIALMGRTRLLLVDEPTTGVDPAAKRLVWSAVRAAQRAGRGVVLTSHSMEECESLCSRLTIMVNGRFQCLGTPQHLKSKFSQGFTLNIKLRADEGSQSTQSGQAAVQDYMRHHFSEPRLMEQHQSLLTYYVAGGAWAHMFGVLERMRRELSVEDYSVTQTTLEQIYLQFTKYQQHNIK